MEQSRVKLSRCELLRSIRSVLQMKHLNNVRYLATLMTTHKCFLMHEFAVLFGSGQVLFLILLIISSDLLAMCLNNFFSGAWAVICCASALFTVLTFSIDMARFPYPVRPIFYLAICYLFISFVFMIGLVAENKISCAAVSYKNKPLVSQGMESSSCVLLGVLHYYFRLFTAVSLPRNVYTCFVYGEEYLFKTILNISFSTASNIWWVVLCVAWFLAANLKWAQESIESLASYFHLIAWGIPALFCIMVLISHSIDGDPFTGICSVGNLKPTTLFNLVFLPLFVCIGMFNAIRQTLQVFMSSYSH